MLHQKTSHLSDRIAERLGVGVEQEDELRIADCGLGIGDCGLRIADWGLGIGNCGLRVAGCLLYTSDAVDERS
ncbi:MAG: hypothetical protein N2204_04120, partial [Anaerolineae bacterium]|nr:hypothetical protein [Anaerolineae bacterium]